MKIMPYKVSLLHAWLVGYIISIYVLEGVKISIIRFDKKLSFKSNYEF